MNAEIAKPWIETVSLHPDVLSEDFSEDIFALDLGPLADGLPNVPAAYKDPEQFFRSSYLTKGLKSLLRDVLSRLGGGSGNRVLKLVTPFGGGKSHTLATLFHAAGNREALDAVPEGKTLPRPPKANIAVFDGQFFDALNGKKMKGRDDWARTMWGWIAWKLGGEKGYRIMRDQDMARVAPGGDEILELLEEGPNLILLDEVLNYLISAGGVKVEKTTLRDETLTFLQRLTVAAGNTKNTSLAFSLQSSKRESLDYTNLLQTVDHLAARKDQRREPVEGNEIMSVIQRRLLSGIPSGGESAPASNAYREIFTQMRKAYAQNAAESEQAEEEGLALRDRIRAAYPFHPALIDLMRERWAAIPDFQRTRGVLRFLAACLRACHRDGKSGSVLGPADVPIRDAEVRLAFFKEVGQHEDFQAVLEHDLVGANARAGKIDRRRAKENPSETGKRHATRIATAILMYSFGGLRRRDKKETLPPGVSEQELLSVCVGPDLDSTTAVACLKELKDRCLYLHFDGVRYCFKKDPNITLLVEQEADSVARDDSKSRKKIKEMLEARLSGHHGAIVWPEKTSEIPDREKRFLFAYLPLEFGGKSKTMKEETARNYFENYGDTPRKFRNGLALAVPAEDQIEILRRSVRYLLAIDQVGAKAKQYNLTAEQKYQLKEREATEKASIESAFLKLYNEVWFPRTESGGITIDSVAVGGRPLQTTLSDKKTAAIHERVLELVTQVHPRIFRSLAPTKILELFRLGEGDPPKTGNKISEIVEGFYSFLGFTRLESADVVRKSVAGGIEKSVFGYFSGPSPSLDAQGKYQVPLMKIRFDVKVAEDEIDLETGFIMIPDSIPASEQTTGDSYPGTKGDAGVGVNDPSITVPDDDSQLKKDNSTEADEPKTLQSDKIVALTFSVDRNGLFAAWDAIANLADMAGQLKISITAESENGFDANKLQNGVLEPLREADLIE